MTYKWDFSDGEGNLPENSQKNPLWRFWQEYGTVYTVSLTVTNAYGSDTITKQDYIRIGAVPTAAPVAAFTSNVQSGSAPLTVMFTDKSSGTPSAYAWDFNNDGKTDSMVKNPSYTYAAAGDYTVSLTATNAQGKDSEVKTGYIRVANAGTTPVTTKPSITVTSPNGGETWQRGTTRTVSWDYTGSPGSSVKIVLLKGTSEIGTIVDSVPLGSGGSGSYAWPVYATASTGSDFKVSVQSISQSAVKDTSNDYFTLTPATSAGVTPTITPAVTTAKLPTAQFTATPVQGKAPLAVQFTDQSVSTGTTTYKWDVNNDGTTDYTTKSPSHTYTAAGTYTVKLTVTNASGSDSETKTGFITATSSGVVTGSSQYGAESNPTGYPIGGGAGYPTYSAATSTYTVTTVAEFKSHMAGGSKPATAGQVVFIPSGTTIDLSGQSPVTIPAGVTIASDRGKNGAAGAKIRKISGSGYSMLTVGGNNVRVTGLVLEGPNPAPETLNYVVMGVLNQGGYTGLVVDNNEIWGWSYAGVFSNGAPTVGRPYVHHNYIHHNQGDGLGYGVNVNGGDLLVEANIFDYNRHSMTGGGLVGEKYEFRYNIILGHGSVVGGVHVDVHENEKYSSNGVACAGTEYQIHHNTVNQGSGTAQQAFIHVRDVPQKGAYIYNNLINTNWGSGSNNDGALSVIYQSCDYSTHFGGIYATNNMWKGTLYPTNAGIVWEQRHA
jgi:PKD repeat protein